MVEIRPATDDDSAALARLTTQLGYPTTALQMAARLARIGGMTLAAVLDGAVVAYVGVTLGQSYEYDDPYARVTALVVDETARRTGVGTSLMGAAETWARTHGARAVVLNSAEHRSDAHAFYERLGYEDTGRRYVKAL